MNVAPQTGFWQIAVAGCSYIFLQIYDGDDGDDDDDDEMMMVRIMVMMMMMIMKRIIRVKA